MKPWGPVLLVLLGGWVLYSLKTRGEWFPLKITWERSP
jgi:hypothetical protein